MNLYFKKSILSAIWGYKNKKVYIICLLLVMDFRCLFN
jgi:hypothetical protein